MKVRIDEKIEIECAYVLKGSNGWVVPVLDGAQTVRALCALEASGVFASEDVEPFGEALHDLGDGFFVLGEGWAWMVDEEGA